MSLGILDLSLVTRMLVDQLGTARTNAGFVPAKTVTFNALSPDENREGDEDECRVSVYLFHVAANPYHRSTYPEAGRIDPVTQLIIPGRAQAVAVQPFGLTLSYLITAYAKGATEVEQQAMSIVLKCFHDQPFTRSTVPLNGRIAEFTVTLEPQTTDEIGRLWQSAALAMRLSAVYRVSVVFLQPDKLPDPELVAEWRLDLDVVDATLPPLSLTATVANGVVLITGVDLPAGPVELRFLGENLQPTTTDPPGPGQYRRASPTRIDFRPRGMPGRGRYVIRLHRAPDAPAAQGFLEVP